MYRTKLKHLNIKCIVLFILVSFICQVAGLFNDKYINNTFQASWDTKLNNLALFRMLLIRNSIY